MEGDYVINTIETFNYDEALVNAVLSEIFAKMVTPPRGRY